MIDPLLPQDAKEAATANAGEVSSATASATTRTVRAYSPHPYRPATPASREILSGPAASGGVSTRPTGWRDPSPGTAAQVSDWREATSEPTTWIEIELVGEDDSPVPGESYRVKLPDGSVVEGTLDTEGCARVSGFSKGGPCEISFPYLDQDAWEEL